MQKQCQSCKGRRKLLGNGMQYKDCPYCDATGIAKILDTHYAKQSAQIPHNIKVTCESIAPIYSDMQPIDKHIAKRGRPKKDTNIPRITVI